MNRLRLETLDEILKKEKAYPHEIRQLVPELKLLREVVDGKRPKSEYAPNTTIFFEVPKALLELDRWVTVADAVTVLEEGGYALVKSNAWGSRRYILFRVK